MTHRAPAATRMTAASLDERGREAAQPDSGASPAAGSGSASRVVIRPTARVPQSSVLSGGPAGAAHVGGTASSRSWERTASGGLCGALLRASDLPRRSRPWAAQPLLTRFAVAVETRWPTENADVPPGVRVRDRPDQRLEDEASREFGPSSPHTLVRSLSDHQNRIALCAHVSAPHAGAKVRKQATSIRVVLPSLHPAFVLMRGVQANLNADTGSVASCLDLRVPA